MPSLLVGYPTEWLFRAAPRPFCWAFMRFCFTRFQGCNTLISCIGRLLLFHYIPEVKLRGMAPLFSGPLAYVKVSLDTVLLNSHVVLTLR